MQVHFISIEVGVIRRSYRQIHTKCWPRKDLKCYVFCRWEEASIRPPRMHKHRNKPSLCGPSWTFCAMSAGDWKQWYRRHACDVQPFKKNILFPSRLACYKMANLYPGCKWRSAARGWYRRSTRAPFSRIIYFAPGYWESPRFTSSWSLTRDVCT